MNWKCSKYIKLFSRENCVDGRLSALKLEQNVLIQDSQDLKDATFPLWKQVPEWKNLKKSPPNFCVYNKQFQIQIHSATPPLNHTHKPWQEPMVEHGVARILQMSLCLGFRVKSSTPLGPLWATSGHEEHHKWVFFLHFSWCMYMLCCFVLLWWMSAAALQRQSQAWQKYYSVFMWLNTFLEMRLRMFLKNECLCPCGWAESNMSINQKYSVWNVKSYWETYFNQFIYLFL